jgi:hypothetical protein
MALSAKDKEKAHWNELGVTALIDYLYLHQAEVGKRGRLQSQGPT